MAWRIYNVYIIERPNFSLEMGQAALANDQVCRRIRLILKLNRSQTGERCRVTQFGTAGLVVRSIDRLEAQTEARPNSPNTSIPEHWLVNRPTSEV